MDNVVSNLLDFFTDAGKSIGTKTASAIVIVFSLFLFDYLTGLSHHFQLSSKLNELEKVSELKLKYSDDSTKLEKLKSIEEKIIKKEHYLDWLSSLFSSGSANQRTTEKISQPKTAKPKISILDIYLMIISSSYGFLFMILASLVSPFLIKIPTDKNLWLGIFAMIIVIGIGAAIATAIAYLFPIIDEKRPYLNYILNGVIHGGFILWFAVWTNKQNKKIQRENAR